MIIIALTGPKEVGKSTFARTICRVSDVPTAVVSFAGPIKEIAHKLGFVHSPDVQKGTPIKRGLSCRDAWTGIGEGLRERLYPEIWIDQMATEIEAHKTMGGNWKILIVDDLRKPNEAEWLRKEHNGFIVELSRDGVDYRGGDTETRLPGDLVGGYLKLYDLEKALNINELSAMWVLRRAKEHYNFLELKHTIPIKNLKPHGY